MTTTTARSGGNVRVLIRATLVGLVLQLVLVFAGHSNAIVRDRLFAPAGTVISLIAGYLYGRWAKPGGSRTAAALGGLVAGAVSAFLAILESFYLGDVPPFVLGFGTLMSAIAGAVGGWFARR